VGKKKFTKNGGVSVKYKYISRIAFSEIYAAEQYFIGMTEME
jgi:hypothetical protein